MTLYRDRFRIETTRLREWDYSREGWYYITICADKRAERLATIADGAVVLTEIGAVAQQEWQRTAVVRPYVILDEYVIMPDHMHAIFALKPVRHRNSPADSPVETSQRDVSDDASRTNGRCIDGYAMPRRETSRRDVSTARCRLRAGSVGAIVGQFKSLVTKKAHAVGHVTFAWQSRFYDRIIRSRRELYVVRQYIRRNPQVWQEKQSQNDWPVPRYRYDTPPAHLDQSPAGPSP